MFWYAYIPIGRNVTKKQTVDLTHKKPKASRYIRTSNNTTCTVQKGAAAVAPGRCHARLARIPVHKHRDALSPPRARSPRFIATTPMLGKTG